MMDLSEAEYRAFNGQILFDNKETDRCFGLISNGVANYRFAWQSDTIEPCFQEIDNGVCLLGIDKNFAVIDFKAEAVKVNMLLDYFFYDVKIMRNNIFIITELEIIEIDFSTYNVVEKFPLPDYFEKMDVFGDKIAVKCLGGEMLII